MSEDEGEGEFTYQFPYPKTDKEYEKLLKQAEREISRRFEDIDKADRLKLYSEMDLMLRAQAIYIKNLSRTLYDTALMESFNEKQLREMLRELYEMNLKYVKIYRNLQPMLIKFRALMKNGKNASLYGLG